MNIRSQNTLFQARGYVFLLASRATSSSILWIDFTLIFSLTTYFWHSSPLSIGITSALYGLPGLLLGPLFGGIADRHNPLKLLYCSYAARGVTSLLLVFAPTANIFIALVFLKGLANLGAMPAEQILTRTILTRDQIVSNAGVMTAIDQLTKIGAPLVGALLAYFHHPQAGFAISFLLAVVGAICLIGLKKSTGWIGRDAHIRPKSNHFGALFDLVKRDEIFRCAFYASVVQSAILGFYDPLLALMLKARGFPDGTFGLIVSCTAAGAVAGALVFRRAFLGGGGLRLIAISLAGFGLTVLVPGATAFCDVDISIIAISILWIANGAFYALAAMSFGVTLQTRCPIESVGTVSATARSAQLFAMVFGPLCGSAVAAQTSIEAVFLMSGSAALIFAICLAHKQRSNAKIRHDAGSLKN